MRAQVQKTTARQGMKKSSGLLGSDQLKNYEKVKPESAKIPFSQRFRHPFRHYRPRFNNRFYHGPRVARFEVIKNKKSPKSPKKSPKKKNRQFRFIPENQNQRKPVPNVQKKTFRPFNNPLIQPPTPVKSLIVPDIKKKYSNPMVHKKYETKPQSNFVFTVRPQTSLSPYLHDKMHKMNLNEMETSLKKSPEVKRKLYLERGSSASSENALENSEISVVKFFQKFARLYKMTRDLTYVDNLNGGKTTFIQKHRAKDPKYRWIEIRFQGNFRNFIDFVPGVSLDENDNFDFNIESVYIMILYQGIARRNLT